jgi:hypothetical protein
MKLRKLFVAGLSLLAVSCTQAPKADTPEGALHSYVTAAFDAKGPSDKKRLVDLSTGDAKGYLERMSDEDFKKQFVDTKLRFLSLKAKDKRTENNGDVSLVYELNYRDGLDPTRASYMNKKIAYLTKEGAMWKIKSTKNMKSFIERKEDLVVTPESTGEEPAAPAQK